MFIEIVHWKNMDSKPPPKKKLNKDLLRLSEMESWVFL